MFFVIKEEQVYKQLGQVMDPELDIDIVSLGLIYKVSVRNKKIHVLMTLTTPGCPLASVIDRMVKEAISNIDGVVEDDVELEVTFDPPWAKDMMSEDARLELGII